MLQKFKNYEMFFLLPIIGLAFPIQIENRE